MWRRQSAWKDWLSPPSAWHKGYKCKTLADGPRTHSNPPGYGVRKEGNWQGCSALSLGRLMCPCQARRGQHRTHCCTWRTHVPGTAGYSGNQLLSQLRRCEGASAFCGSEETVVQGRDPFHQNQENPGTNP